MKGEGRGVKHCCGWVIFAVVLALGWGAARLILSATAEYPSLGELALYPVNELSGFTLSFGFKFAFLRKLDNSRSKSSSFIHCSF